MKNNQWQVDLEDLLLDKIRPWEVTVFVLRCCHKKYFKKLLIFVILEINKKCLAHSRIFKDHDPNSRTFQGLEFFPTSFRIFKDCSNPELIAWLFSKSMNVSIPKNDLQCLISKRSFKCFSSVDSCLSESSIQFPQCISKDNPNLVLDIPC